MACVPVPIIAVVNGHCITGGFELALACDILVGSTKASFCDTHVKFGLAPCWGLSQKLPRLIGPSRAALLSYSAGKLDAGTAKDWGLLAHVFPPEQLMEEALKIAGAIATNDARMVRKYKKVLAAGFRRLWALSAMVEEVSGFVVVDFRVS
ncbi:ClpP/crotonase-like domain-containing protein [Baffinella frigidus]|nr:ClpP/crotonase-like domain-containing protein [Cryptophyta sp. CCMP2293]